MIIKVLDEYKADKCDELLTKLIQDERQYDSYINENFIVKDYFKNIIKDKNNILLCYEENENIVGYTYFKYQNNEDSIGYLIDGLYVEEENRKRGIAKTLIKEGLKIISDYKIDFVDINVMYNNKIAIKLYESLGFNALSLKMRMKMD